jgi:hypothetical protein
MTRDLSNTNWGIRISEMGYALHGNVVDSFGRTWKYRISPITGGSIGYFNKLGDLTLWVRQVDEVRCMAKPTSQLIDAIASGMIKPAQYSPLPWGKA